MRLYTREIPGKKHEANEDSHYASIFYDKNGKEWALGVVADGLSGYGGLAGSHMAVESVRLAAEQRVYSYSGDDSLGNVLKEIVSSTNAKLDQSIGDCRTCIDVALASAEEVCIAHLGDSSVYFLYGDGSSRRITKKEESGGAPSNYIGKEIIDDLGIDKRINLLQPYKEGIPKPQYILLATDGVDSRVAKETMDAILHGRKLPWLYTQALPQERQEELLQRAEAYPDPGRSIEWLVQEIHFPGWRLQELEFKKLRYIFKDSIFARPEEKSAEVRQEKTIPATKKELLEMAMDGYLRGDPKICLDVDYEFKPDDATLVLIDLEDTVGSTLRRAWKVEKELIPRLEQRIPELERQCRKATGERDEAQRENARLSELTRTLEQRVAAEQEASAEAVRSLQQLREKYDQQEDETGRLLREMENNIGEKERECQRKKTSLRSYILSKLKRFILSFGNDL